MPKVLLKGRPTPAQIADRMAAPVPGGMELYLDATDIADDEKVDEVARLCLASRPAGCEFVVEGPLRSLDGAFFDVTVLNEANRTVIDRAIRLGRSIGARGAVIHAMAARPSARGFDADRHNAALEAALPLFHYYARACLEAGLVPTVENVPPVARMREGSYMFSLLGTPPSDLLFFLQHVAGLRMTVDVSHAQLYVNAVTSRWEDGVPGALESMVSFIQGQDRVASLDAYLDPLEDHLFEAHISNARGLLGEGLAYSDGDIDLDRAVRRIATRAAFLVTETIEDDPERAIRMRDAQRRIETALAMDGKVRDAE